jgi:exopolyphosphatase/guanosine-5'-triphosphate,3'-diphosphate pyrophosphatase
VLERVRAVTGVELRVLSGADEARYTFLAVRRWFCWSAGRLLVLDIGGGSLNFELAAGRDEDPELAVSLPLGAGRLTRMRWRSNQPNRADINALRAELDAILEPTARRIHALGECELAVGTSKTFRSLARLAGAAPSSAGIGVPRSLTDVGLRQVFGFISRMSSADLAELDGVSAGRAHQLVAGALVAAAAMRALRVNQLEICPWALREGAILRRLDTFGAATQHQRPWPLTDGHGHDTTTTIRRAQR